MNAATGEKPLKLANKPLVIDIVASSRDGEVICALLRTILEGEEPYEHVGLVGARELYDGRTWKRRDEWNPTPARAELSAARIAEHVRRARKAGLSYLLVQREEGSNDTKSLAHFTCTLGAGGSGTVCAGARGLSFSIRSPMADVGCRDVRVGYGLTRFVAVTPSWEDTVAVSLTGRFNTTPALAAITVCELLGIDEGRVATGLLMTRAMAHGSLIMGHDQRLFALVEDSPDPRDGRRLAAAAREEYLGFTHEIVCGAAAVEGAVERAAMRDGRTMLVLLGAPARRLEDAFQAAVRRVR